MCCIHLTCKDVTANYLSSLHVLFGICSFNSRLPVGRAEDREDEDEVEQNEEENFDSSTYGFHTTNVSIL